MVVNFIQGIVSYPYSGTVQQFLAYSAGYVSILTSRGPTSINLAHGSKSYLFTETNNVAAWGPLPATNSWLYWNINPVTGVRTFGYTLLEPVWGPTSPSSPANDQHWFNTSEYKMYVFNSISNSWFNVIRVFAAKCDNSGQLYPLGVTTSPTPFAGTQVALSGHNLTIGQIMADDSGLPIRNSQGQFFTTADQFFINGDQNTAISIENTVVGGTAIEVLPAYSVVAFNEVGSIRHCTYNDLQTVAVAMLTGNLNPGDTGSVVLQGYIENPNWNWPTVGQRLWIDDTGMLTPYNLNTTDPTTHIINNPPVAITITPTSVYFNQGLGGVGPQGPRGISNVYPATTSLLGISRLSVASATPDNPVVVGDNDPRNSDARAPLAHAQPATSILPTPVGLLTGTTLQDDLAIIANQFLPLSGGSLTGVLLLSSDPTLSNAAATKQYVDNSTNQYVRLSGGTMTGPLVLSGDPLTALGAATKRYVDYGFVSLTGSTMIGSLILDANPSVALGAATKQYVDGVTVDRLADVVAPTPSTNDILRYNGTNWVNSSSLTALEARYNALVSSFPYDITFSFAGILLSGKTLGGNVVTRSMTIPTNATGSLGKINTPAIVQTVLNIFHNGVSVGTVNFAVASQTATFSVTSPILLTAGDTIELQTDPTNFDGTITNIYVTFVANSFIAN